MIANTFFYPPPAEGAAAAILEARRQIFGHVPGDGTRSGRKAFRQKLKGQVIKDWYHLRITDLPLHEIGLENPVREELYRKEEELNRIGKTRIKGKVRGPGEEFVREMKLADATEEILEPIDVFLPEDALPEDGSAERLAEELDLDEEERGWLAEILASYPREAENPEDDDGSGEVKKEGKKTKEEKKAGARKMSFRTSIDDKRVRPSSRREGDDGDEGEDEAQEAEAAAGGDAAAEAAAEGEGEGEPSDFSLTFNEEEISALPEDLRESARAQAARHAAVKAAVGEQFKRGHPIANFAALWESADGVSKPAWLDKLAVSDSEEESGSEGRAGRRGGRAKRRANAAAAGGRAAAASAAAPADDAGSAGAAEATAAGEAKPADAKE